MSGLILDFGGRREAVCAALQKLVATQAIRILVLPKALETELAYHAFDSELNYALESFVNGEVSSVQVHGEAPSTLVGGVYGPRFAGGVLEEWSGSVESMEVGHKAFNGLQTIAGLSYVALSFEESPDLEVPNVTTETFPWSDWRLIAGAIRQDDGQWLSRRIRAIGC